MKIHYAKWTDFGWHVEVDRNDWPFSVMIDHEDMDNAFRRSLRPDEGSDVEAFLSTDPHFETALDALRNGVGNKHYPSIRDPHV